MPVLALAPSLIAGATSIIGGLIGSSKAKKAAAAQAAANQAAGAAVNKATGEAQASGQAGMDQANAAVNTGTDAANRYISDAGTAQKDIYGNMTAGTQPYQAAGAYGLNQLQSTAGKFAFNPTDMENEPGYQFQLAQGNKALQASAAGRGMLQSGSSLKAMDNYSQGLAGTSYQNAYNRALSTFNTNQQGYQSLANMGQNANSQNIQAGGIYGGQLTSLAGMGASTNMQGAGMKSNLDMQGNEYIGTTGMQGAEAAGRFTTGAGDAKAAGTMGAANAWSSAASGVGKAANGATYALNNMQSDPNSGPATGWSSNIPIKSQTPYTGTFI